MSLSINDFEQVEETSNPLLAYSTRVYNFHQQSQPFNKARKTHENSIKSKYIKAVYVAGVVPAAFIFIPGDGVLLGVTKAGLWVFILLKEIITFLFA